MTTPLFLLRCLQIGLSLSDLDLLTIGMVNDMYCESRNDEEWLMICTVKVEMTNTRAGENWQLLRTLKIFRCLLKLDCVVHLWYNLNV